MNGLVKLQIGEESYTLSFGMMGCMEFERRVVETPTTNKHKIMVDMIYSGLFGDAMMNDRPPVKYGDVCILVERLHDQDDYVEQLAEVNRVYAESKWGKDLLDRMDKFSKKNKEVKKKAEQTA